MGPKITMASLEAEHQAAEKVRLDVERDRSQREEQARKADHAADINMAHRVNRLAGVGFADPHGSGAVRRLSVDEATAIVGASMLEQKLDKIFWAMP